MRRVARGWAAGWVMMGAVSTAMSPAAAAAEVSEDALRPDVLLQQVDDLDPALLERFEVQWADDRATTMEQTRAHWRDMLEQRLDEPRSNRRERYQWAGEVLTFAAVTERHAPDADERFDAAVQAARLLHRLRPDGSLGVAHLRAYRQSLADDETELRQRARRAKLELAMDLREPLAWIDHVDDPGQVLTTLFDADPDDSLPRRLAERWFRVAAAEGDFAAARAAIDHLERHASDESDELFWKQLRGELSLRLGQLAAGHRALRPVMARMRERIDEGEDEPHRLNHLDRALGSAMHHPQPSGRPTFMTDDAMDRAYERWQSEEALPAERLETLLERAATGNVLVRVDEQTMISGWTVINRLARRADRVAAEPADAPDALAEPAAELEAWLVRYRRWPHDGAGREALLAAGEIALRRGWAGLGGRSLREFLEAGPDEALASLLEEQLRRLEPAERAASTTGHAEAPPHTLRLPAAVRPGLWRRSWLRRHPAYEIHALEFTPGLLADGGQYFLATPYLLARLDESGDAAWMQQAPRPADLRTGSGELRRLTAPAPVVPAVGGGLVVARWGLDAADELLTGVAAFDRESGASRWDTADDADWDDLRPVGDPTIHDGRVYLPVLRHAGNDVPLVASLGLACLDLDTGRTRWVSPIVNDAPLTPGREMSYDLLHYGSRATAAEGAVYLVTGMGVIARLDARDGLVEWAHHYHRPATETLDGRLLGRPGSPAVLIGDLLVCVPRDDLGALALRADDGQLVWRDRTLPADGIAGVGDDHVVLHHRHGLLAVAADSGEQRWDVAFDEPMTLAPARRDDVLAVTLGGQLREIALADGAPLAVHDLPAGLPAAAVAGEAGRFIVLHDDPDQVQPLPAFEPSEAASAADQVHHAVLDRPRAELWQPPQASDGPPATFVFSDGLLECIDITGEPSARWQRHVAPGVLSHARHGEALVLLYPRRVLAVAVADGATLWEVSLPEETHNWRWVGDRLLVADRNSQWRRHEMRWIGAVDLDAGELRWHRKPLSHWLILAHYPAGGDEDAFYLVHPEEGRDAPFGPGSEVWRVDAGTGRISHRQRLFDEAKAEPPKLRTVEGHDLFAVGDARRVFRIDLRQPGEPIELGRLPEAFDFSDDHTELHVHGPYLEVRRKHADRHESAFFHRAGEQPPFHVEQGGHVHDGHLYVTDDGALQIIDLATQAELGRLDLPERDGATLERTVHLHVAGERVTLFSIYKPDEGDAFVGVDRVHARTAEHQHGLRLPELDSDALERAARDDAIRGAGERWLIATAGQVHLFELPAAMP